MTKGQLTEELKQRGLVVTGTDDERIQRLEDDDRRKILDHKIIFLHFYLLYRMPLKFINKSVESFVFISLLSNKIKKFSEWNFAEIQYFETLNNMFLHISHMVQN